MNYFKAYIIKDKTVADIRMIDYENHELQIVNSEDRLSFSEVHFMESTGMKDINGNDIYKGHVLYELGNLNKRLLYVKEGIANGAVLSQYINVSYNRMNRVSWTFADRSIIIGTIWDDIKYLYDVVNGSDNIGKDVLRI